MLVLEGGEDSVDESDFFNVELLAGGKLPPLFKEIYLKNNGGFPEAKRVEGDEYVFSINGFSPVRFGKLPIERLMQDYVDQDEGLKGYVPFAYDDGGNSFMLSLAGENSGVVYLLIQDGMQFVRVCESFDDFIGSLRLV